MSYVNGSDMLLSISGAAFGHCTTHTTTFNSETKDRKVKPVASLAKSSGLWADKGVIALSISIRAEGLLFYNETETSFRELLALWKSGESVTVTCFERENDSVPYLEGEFVISSLERTDPAQDDSTVSISLENSGEPTTFNTTTAFSDYSEA